MTCPHCREAPRCNGFRHRQLVSLFGPLDYARHYYHCAACHRGNAPLDGTLGLRAHDLTPAADELVCPAGLVDSFATGAQKILARLSGLHLSESTVQRTTEAAGQRLAEAQHAGEDIGPPTPWDWHKDAEGQRVGDVSVDATGVGQQGPRGQKAEGKMVYVGMVYNPVPQDRDRRAN
ncbi:MAG: ISKra4-like element ISSiac4 family transposase, partial [Planctomycetia bacterium]